ncbi:MAG: hypothetical protein AAGL49_08300 [Pseudomonadota bacterium]
MASPPVRGVEGGDKGARAATRRPEDSRRPPNSSGAAPNFRRGSALLRPLVRRQTELMIEQDVLRQMIEAISEELELRPLLSKLARLACKLLEADYGSIGLVADDGGSVRSEAVHNIDEAEVG